MLRRVVLELKGDISDFSEQSGALFHGILFENVPSDYGNSLHISRLKPFSQHIEKKEDKLEWTICTLNDEVYEKMIVPILDSSYNTIEVKHKHITLDIVNKEVTTIKEEELVEKTYFTDSSSYITVNFSTPTAFKSNDKYVFYPDIKLIYQSLVKKYDEFTQKTKIGSADVIQQLTDYTEVTFYSLRSTTFAIKGNINSFYGTITLKVNGPQMMKNLANLLFEYGEYSGVGIKCALGMGAIKLKRRRKQEC